MVAALIILSTIKPLSEIVEGKKPSEWTANLKQQLPNAVKLFILEVFTYLVVVVPLIILLALLVPDALPLLDFAKANEAGDQVVHSLINALIKALVAILRGIAIGVLLMAVIVFFLTFVRIELALSDVGLLQAAKNSIRILKANLFEVFLFHFIWFTLGVVLFFLSILACCFSGIVGSIVAALVLLPIRLLSEIVLWRQLALAATQKLS